MRFGEVVENVGKAVDGLGVAVIVVGVAAALFVFGARVARGIELEPCYRQARRSIGRSILLGLELLVAGDIIRTVAVSPSFRSVGVLAVIVAIRTFLSFTLETEVTGHWPWQQARSVPEA